jgi:indole-3-glycerol phosphate synthase
VLLDDELIERRRRQNLSAPRQDARGVTPSIRNFAQAIDRQRQGLERVPLLRASRPDLIEVARALDDAEAAALAVSMDDPQQELERFSQAARAVSIPVLRADLVLEEFQIYQSRAAGADAVLLHARALTPEMLARLAQAASSAHMTAVVNCDSPEHVARAAAARVQVLALAPGLQAPPRTLLLSLGPFDPAQRGRIDAVLDDTLDDAAAFRAALEGE